MYSTEIKFQSSLFVSFFDRRKEKKGTDGKDMEESEDRRTLTDMKEKINIISSQNDVFRTRDVTTVFNFNILSPLHKTHRGK